MTVSTMALQGKRVLVTGAGRGIGRAIALICHKHGARVAITSRTTSQIEETAMLASKTPMTLASSSGSCNGNDDNDNNNNTNDDDDDDDDDKMLALTCDVTDPTQVESTVQQIVDRWGGLDVLINNAGGAQPTKGTVGSLTDPQEFVQLLRLNVVGVHTVTSAVLRSAMERNGRIVNISSRAGKVGIPNMSFYVATKFAVEGLTATWAKELHDRNIVVNSISPGMVDTQSFPKSPGRPGVRSAESIEDTLMMALTAPMEFSGHYVHADELDTVRKRSLPDTDAWKKIDESPIEDVLPHG